MLATTFTLFCTNILPNLQQSNLHLLGTIRFVLLVYALLLFCSVILLYVLFLHERFIKMLLHGIKYKYC